MSVGSLKTGTPSKKCPHLKFWELPLLGSTQPQSLSPPRNSYSFPIAQGFPSKFGFEDVPDLG